MERNGKRVRRPNRKLMELRLNAGLSPNALAALANTSGPTIRLAEKGHVPSPHIQFAIAQVFDLKPTDIWPLPGQVREPVAH